MWVKISKPEDTKKLKVGDEVRVDGKEYKCTKTYSPTDYGFDVYGELTDGYNTIGNASVRQSRYTIELWEEQEATMNKQYKIKLKQGDACKIEGLTEEQYHQVCKRFIESGAGGSHYDDSYHRGDTKYIEWHHVNLCHTDILENHATVYTYEEIMEDEGKMIERDKEYDIKLTGEELFLVTLLLAKTTGDMTTHLWRELKSISGITDDITSTIPLGIIHLTSSEAKIMEVMDKFFTKPVTEQEKKIREMEEQYAALGKSIEEVKKGIGV